VIRTDLVVQTRAAFLRPSVVLGLATLAVHVVGNGGYGFFRDELYFIVCGQHPDWGYVDQPPVVPLIAAGFYALFAHSLTLFRLAPGLAMAATVAATAEFARALGGGRPAQWLAGLCALCAPVLLALGVFYTTDMLQPLFWLMASWCLVKRIRTGDERWWLGFGAAVGAGLWSKYLIAFYAAALIASLPATPLRRSLASPWFYAGALLAVAMIAPNIAWQYRHDWPFLELSQVLSHEKNRALSPPAFLAQQVFAMGPLTVLVWGAGLWGFAARAPYRPFAIAWVLLVACFIAEHGKANYMAAIYPVLLAGGAVFWEQRGVRARLVLGAAIAAEAVAFAPMAMPILPEETIIAYMAALHVGPALTSAENHINGRMPQHFGDMHGWPELAEKVAAIYWRLPPRDRQHAVFYGRNYGDAAAVDLFGRALGLPPAISPHNNYYLWGPHGADGSVMITLGGDPEFRDKAFRSVELAGRTDNPYAQPSEIQPIYVLRGMKPPLAQRWPKLKRYH